MTEIIKTKKHGNVEVPDGFRDLPPDEQQAMLREALGMTSGATSEPMSALEIGGGILDAALQGLTLYTSDEMGGAALEIANAPYTLFTDQEFGDAYKRRVAKKRQDYKNFGEQYPKTAIGSNVAGAVLPIAASYVLGGPSGAAPTAATAARVKGILDSSRLLAGGMTKPGATLAQRTVEGIKLGGTQGFVAGVGSNESDAESFGGLLADKAGSGVIGTGIGATIGTVLPSAISATASLGNKLLIEPFKFVRNKLSGAAPSEFSKEEIKAINNIGKLFLNDEISAEDIIIQIKKNVSADKLEGVTPVEILADYGGDAVVRKLRGLNIVTPGSKISTTLSERGSGTVEQKGTDILEDQTSNIQSTRIIDSLEESSGKTIKTEGINLGSGIDEILEATQKKLGPLYTKAFDENKIVSNLDLYKFLEVPTIKASYKAAKDAYLLETQKLNPGKRILMDDLGIPDLQNLFIRNANGQITGVVKELPLMFLDQIKRVVDRKTFALKTTTGSNKIDQRTVDLRKEVSNQFRNLLKNSVKGDDYANVLNQASNRFSLNDAFEMGAKLRGKTTKSDFFKKKFNSLKTDAEKDAFRMGVFEEILTDINKLGDNTNLAKKLLDTPDVANKIKILFEGIPGGGQAFINRLIREDKIAKTNQTVLGGSNTAEKQVDAGGWMQNLSDAIVAFTAPTSSAGIRAEANLANKTANTFFDKAGRERQAYLNALLNQNPNKQMTTLELMQELQRQEMIKGDFGNFTRSSLMRNLAPNAAAVTQDLLLGN